MQWFHGRQVTNTAAQHSLFGQRDEAGLLLRQLRRHFLLRDFGQVAAGGHAHQGLAGHVQQELPLRRCQALRRGRIKRHRRVAHHTVLLAGHITTIAIIEHLRFPTLLPGQVQQHQDRRLAARLLRRHRVNVQVTNGLDAPVIQPFRIRIRMVMAEIRTGDNNRLVVNPLRQRLGHLRRVSLANHHRQDFEVLHHPLQEGHLHLDRMLPRLRRVLAFLRRRLRRLPPPPRPLHQALRLQHKRRDRAQPLRLLRDRHQPQRRLVSVRIGDARPLEKRVVARSHDHDGLNFPPGQQFVADGGCPPGKLITRVRTNQPFQPGDVVFGRTGQQAVNRL